MKTQAEIDAMADLKAKVAEFMDDAKADALERIDRIQAAGGDIVGDHMACADKCWVTPRNFIAAFAEQMKSTYGWVKDSDTPTRKRTIKNYWRLM